MSINRKWKFEAVVTPGLRADAIEPVPENLGDGDLLDCGTWASFDEAIEGILPATYKVTEVEVHGDLVDEPMVVYVVVPKDPEKPVLTVPRAEPITA